MNGKHNCVEKRTDWSISMELDQEKQKQEAAERCRALAQRIVRELAPRSVQVLEDSGLLEKAFCKMNTAVVQSAPELLVVADPQWVSLPAVQALGVGETLNDTFTYTVSDGHGGTASNTLTVTINGTEGKIVEQTVILAIRQDGEKYMKLYFGESGIDMNRMFLRYVGKNDIESFRNE